MMRGKCLVWILVLLMVSPLGTVSANEKLVDMEFRDAPLVEVFQVLAEIGGLNVLVDPSVSGTVSFYLRELDVLEALDLVSRTTGYRYQIVGNTLVVASEERLRREFAVEEFAFLHLENADVKAAQQLVELVVPNVKLYVDNTQNLLIVYGTKSDITLAKELVERFDQTNTAVLQPIVPAKEEEEITPPSEELVEKSVVVQYVDGAGLLPGIQGLVPNRDLKWDRDLKVIRGKATESEWTKVQGFIWEKDLPAFILKGIVDSQSSKLALVEYNKSLARVREGDNFHEWTVASISPREVTFVQGERTLTIRMGR